MFEPHTVCFTLIVQQLSAVGKPRFPSFLRVRTDVTWADVCENFKVECNLYFSGYFFFLWSDENESARLIAYCRRSRSGRERSMRRRKR
jgi:hypothetical protein